MINLHFAPPSVHSHGQAAKWWWVVGVRGRRGTRSIVRNHISHRISLPALLLLAPLVTGCGSTSDFLSKDAQWFSRAGRLSISNVSIEAPPLTPNKPVTAEDLVSADGMCPGMAPAGAPADANAQTEAPASATPPPTGTVALGHTECDVVRGIGVPDSVNLSNNGRGDRVTVVNYSRGPRAGIYTFTAGRLSSIEGVPEVAKPAKPAKSKTKRKSAAT